MAEFSWPTFWQGTLSGIAGALGGAPQPAQPTPTPTARPTTGAGLGGMLPIIAAVGVGVVALILIMRK